MRKQNGCLFFIYFMFLLLFFLMDVSSAATTKPEKKESASAAKIEPDKKDNDALLPPAPSIAINDPYEHFNRNVLTFNEKLDNLTLKPLAKLYNAIMPKPLNQGIHNIFNNLNELPTIANDILQLHFYQMSNDLWRLTINTTFGIGGLFDVASRMHLPYYSNDFGLTLAYWGYVDSTYMVWPFFGPSTIRDGIEIPVDYYAFSIYPYIHPQYVRYAVFGLNVIDRRAQLLLYQPVFEEAAIDRYVFLRNAYLQRRKFQIEKNRQLGTEYRHAINREEALIAENDKVANPEPAPIKDNENKV